MRALCAAGAACVHYLAGKESINISGKCHSGLARQEISKIYACCRGSMRRKTTSLTVLPVIVITLILVLRPTINFNLILKTP